MLTLSIVAVLGLVSLFTTGCVIYLGLLTLLSAPLAPPPPPQRYWRFAVLVPAHNESAGLVATLQSLQRIDWPAEAWQLVVIADNCNDDTAAISRAAGAEVWERHDLERQGKGHALQFGFARCLSREFDAVVVVDADALVTPNLLAAYASRLDAGALAMQAYYGVSNPHQSWRTRLVTIAYGAIHGVRARGRERLGVSTGLRGNGMCLSRNALQQVPFELDSLAEDLEYSVLLGFHGIRVVYVEEARADAEMLVGSNGASAQRHRWETGRRLVARRHLWPLLRRAWQTRDAVCLELAFDLVTPPLAQLGWLILGLAASAAIASLWWPPATWIVLLVVAQFWVLLAYVLRGWWISGAGIGALASLFVYASFYMLWKIPARLRERGNRQWRRSHRK